MGPLKRGTSQSLRDKPKDEARTVTIDERQAA